MKKLTLLALLCVGATVAAQTVNGTPLAQIESEYLDISPNGVVLGTTLSLVVDYGQRTHAFASVEKESILKDNAGKKMEFNSMVHALNYMHSQGYELVQVFEVFVDANNRVNHYVLKRVKW
jgi:hypothetical protein